MLLCILTSIVPNFYCVDIFHLHSIKKNININFKWSIPIQRKYMLNGPQKCKETFLYYISFHLDRWIIYLKKMTITLILQLGRAQISYRFLEWGPEQIRLTQCFLMDYVNLAPVKPKLLSWHDYVNLSLLELSIIR
jgi:hypothetical protein